MYYNVASKIRRLTPGEDMESVGEQLRKERERQGLTLQDISASTRISLKNLSAVEDDDLSQFCSAFFYRSFVRQFAERLDLESSEFAAAVQSQAKTMPEPAMPGQVSAPLLKVPPIQSSKTKTFRSIFSVVALIAVLAGCSRVYAMWQDSRNNLEASVTSFVFSLSGKLKTRENRAIAAKKVERPAVPVQQAIQNAPAPSSDGNSQAEAVQQRPEAVQNDNGPDLAKMAAPDDQSENPVTEAEAPITPEFRVEVAAIEPTWLSIVADEKQIYSGTLEPAQTKVLEWHDTARIRTGNAAGLTVSFNGKDIGSLGPHGQIRTVVFTKDSYDILEPSPELQPASFSPSFE